MKITSFRGYEFDKLLGFAIEYRLPDQSNYLAVINDGQFPSLPDTNNALFTIADWKIPVSSNLDNDKITNIGMRVVDGVDEKSGSRISGFYIHAPGICKIIGEQVGENSQYAQLVATNADTLPAIHELGPEFARRQAGNILDLYTDYGVKFPDFGQLFDAAKDLEFDTGLPMPYRVNIIGDDWMLMAQEGVGKVSVQLGDTDVDLDYPGRCVSAYLYDGGPLVQVANGVSRDKPMPLFPLIDWYRPDPEDFKIAADEIMAAADDAKIILFRPRNRY